MKTMNPVYVVTTPGVGYTVHCLRGSNPLTVQSYDAEENPALSYTIGPGRSAYIPVVSGKLRLEGAGKCAWRITPLSPVGEEGAADALSGPQGDQGEPGASAYELAVAGGYGGTVEEWLASLKGEPGEAPKDCLTAVDLMVLEGVEMSTPAGTDNANCNYVELAAARSFEGTLSSVTYRTGTNANGMTTAPLWLAVWEQEAEGSSNYTLLGVSRNSITQAINSDLSWLFEALPLQGRRLRLIPTSDPEIPTASTSVVLRVRTSTSTDDTACYSGSTAHRFTPKMTLAGIRYTPRYAEVEELDAHAEDQERHITAAERDAWNALAETAGSGSSLSSAQAAILAAFEWNDTYGLSVVHTTDGVVDGRLRLMVNQGYASIVSSYGMTIQAPVMALMGATGYTGYSDPSTGVSYCFSGHTMSEVEMTVYGIAEACTWCGDPKLPLNLRYSELRLNGATLETVVQQLVDARLAALNLLVEEGS